MAPFAVWELITGAAEAFVFLMLPLGAIVLLVTAIVQRSGELLRTSLVALVVAGVLGWLGCMTGFLDPLAEIVAKVR